MWASIPSNGLWRAERQDPASICQTLPSPTSNSSWWRREFQPLMTSKKVLSPEAGLRHRKVFTWATFGPLWHKTGFVTKTHKNSMSGGYVQAFSSSSLYFSIRLKILFKGYWVQSLLLSLDFQLRSFPVIEIIKVILQFPCLVVFSLRNVVPLKWLLLRLALHTTPDCITPLLKGPPCAEWGALGGWETPLFSTWGKKILELFCYFNTLSLAEQKVFFRNPL